MHPKTQFELLKRLETQNLLYSESKAPFVPFLPILTVLVNIYLMINLSSTTWYRFVFWLILGKLMATLVNGELQVGYKELGHL